MTSEALRHLQDLRRQLLEPPQALHLDTSAEAVGDTDTAAA
jgi:hypothetical protein